MENLYEKKGTYNLFGDKMPILSSDKLRPRFLDMPVFSNKGACEATKLSIPDAK
jgi:hypothetical protein